MTQPAIRIENLSKQYRVGVRSGAPYRTLRETIVEAARAPWRMLKSLGAPRQVNSSPTTIWALKDVSLEIQPGEVLGVIGRNGAGKSTLLKILSRITEPTTGQVELRGRVGSLLEVGTGFHHELTGRENVFLNGAILGMSKTEIERKFDEIVDFAGVADFLDTPVKHYSSGMYTRLAFAVAAHLETEILLVDEVLAVGDVGFQKKCLTKIRELHGGGRTVLFVSHNMPAVAHLCSRCLVFEGGKLLADLDPAAAVARYHQICSGNVRDAASLREHPGRMPRWRPFMTSVDLGTGGAAPGNTIQMNDDLIVTIQFESEQPLTSIGAGVIVKNHLQMPVFGVDTKCLPCPPAPPGTKRGKIVCRCDRLPLTPGLYTLDLVFGTSEVTLDVVSDAIEFEVFAADVFGTGKIPPSWTGNVFWPATWTIQADETVAAESR